MINIRHFAFALLAATTLSACGSDATSDNKNTDTMMAPSGGMVATNDAPPAQNDDAAVVSELVQSMHGGVAVMKQAQQKSTMAPVKALAKKLETEHTMLLNDLQALASKKGWNVPATASAEDMKKGEELAAQTSPDYEKDWLETLKEKHEINIKKLEDHKTTDADVIAASQKGIPKLKELLGRIEGLQKTMK